MVKEFIQNQLERFTYVAEALISTVAARRSYRGRGVYESVNENITTKTTFKKIRKMEQYAQLRVLSRLSPEIKKAIELYKTFTNTSITPWGENNRVENAIKESIEMMADRGINIEQLINENIYDIYVMGFMAMQNIAADNDPQKEIIGIRNIQPEYIAFEEIVVPEFEKPIDAIGYYPNDYYYGSASAARTRSSNDFIALQSIVHKEPNFYYGAVNTMSDSLRGKSMIESAINLAISSGEKGEMMDQYLRGKIFPNEIFAVDPSDYLRLVSEGKMKSETVKELLDDAVDQITEFGAEADASQILALAVKVQRIQAGTVDGRLDGLETINDSHDVSFPRALNVPQGLLGAKRSGNSLSDTQTTHDVLSFYKTILSIREITAKGYKKLFKPKLAEMGVSGEGGIEFDSKDPELKSLLAAAMLQEAQTGQIHTEMGTFTAEELREAYVTGHLDLRQFPPEMPETDAEPQQPTEPEGDME